MLPAGRELCREILLAYARAIDHFLIFDARRLPVPVFIKQAKLIGIGKTVFLRFHFHPPAPELTFFGCRLHVDANSRAVEKSDSLHTALLEYTGQEP